MTVAIAPVRINLISRTSLESREHPLEALGQKRYSSAYPVCLPSHFQN